MSASWSNNITRLSSSTSSSSMMDEGSANKAFTGANNKQGIVSILGCEETKTLAAVSSMRRTLSADMSSNKWLDQQAFPVPTMKKIASVAEFSSLVPAEPETNLGQFDIWTSIQSQKVEKGDPTAKSDSVAPYIHPLVRKTSSSLSEKSLEICTESLGSETGSDGFSSYPASETGDLDGEELQPHPQQVVKEIVKEELLPIAKYNKNKIASPKPFPPPLASLIRGGHDRSSLIRMQSHRQNGRLVLEAVSVPSHNYFNAERHDGRLLLTFAKKTSEDEQKEAQEEIPETDNKEFKMLDEETVADKIMVVKPKIEIGVMSKLKRLANRNPSATIWPRRVNQVIQFEEDEENEIQPTTALSKSFSLPSRTMLPPLIPTSPFNVYDHYWSKSPKTIFGATKPLQNQLAPMKNNNNDNNTNNNNDNNTNNNKSSSMMIFSKSGNTQNKAYEQQQQSIVLRLGDKSCKDPRRSLLLWENQTKPIIINF